MNLQKLTKKDIISHINSLNSTLSKIKHVDEAENTITLDEVTQLGQILDTSLNEILIFDTHTLIKKTYGKH